MKPSEKLALGIACPRCPAGPAEFCSTEQGRRSTRPHLDRIYKAVKKAQERDK